MARTPVRYLAEEQRRLPLRPFGSGGVHRALIPWSPRVRLQVTASNFSLGLRSVCLHLADSPRTTSALFRGGYCPIRPVMHSRCLSAAGIRFLVRSCACWGVRPPLPLAYRHSCRTPSGLSRSACVRDDRGGCRFYSGAVVSGAQATAAPVCVAQDRRVNHPTAA